MKNKYTYLGACFSVVLLFSSCATGPAPAPSFTMPVGDLRAVADDQVVVVAEKTTRLALETFDALLKAEYNNRELLAKASPEIKNYADYVRKNAQQWLRNARAMTVAYKTNRNAQTKADLVTAISVLQEAINQSKMYISRTP